MAFPPHISNHIREQWQKVKSTNWDRKSLDAKCQCMLESMRYPDTMSDLVACHMDPDTGVVPSIISSIHIILGFVSDSEIETHLRIGGHTYPTILKMYPFVPIPAIQTGEQYPAINLDYQETRLSNISFPKNIRLWAFGILLTKRDALLLTMINDISVPFVVIYSKGLAYQKPPHENMCIRNIEPMN